MILTCPLESKCEYWIVFFFFHLRKFENGTSTFFCINNVFIFQFTLFLFFSHFFNLYYKKYLKIISERKINQAKEEEQCCSSHFDTDGNSDSSTVLLQTEQNQWFDFIPFIRALGLRQWHFQEANCSPSSRLEHICMVLLHCVSKGSTSYFLFFFLRY